MRLDIKKKKLKALLISFDKQFEEYASDLFDCDFDFTPREKNYDIIAIGEKESKIIKEPISADVIFCPDSLKHSYPIKTSGLISCGMDSRCTLTFSSISDDHAFIALNRNIITDSLELTIHEQPISFIRDFSIYDNLILGGIKLYQIGK